MSNVTKPYADFVNNLDVADAVKVNAQFNALYNFLNAANIDFTNLAAAIYSMNSVASTLVERDASQNIAYNFAKSGQNPNLLFNPSARLGLQGWTVANAGGSSWTAQYGSTGEGGFFAVGSVTNAVPILTSTKFPVNAGMSLALSCEMFASGVTAGAQAVDVQFFDAGGASLSTLGRTVATNGTTWAKYSNTVTVPANAVTAAVRCYGDSGFTTTNSGWRKIKVEGGSVFTTFSDDNTLNTFQYGSVLGLAQLLSGGYKFQSGQVSVATSAGGSPASGAVTFATAFSSAPIVLPSIGNLSAGEAGYTTLNPSGITSTGFNARVTSYIAQTVQFNWIAIGT